GARVSGGQRSVEALERGAERLPPPLRGVCLAAEGAQLDPVLERRAEYRTADDYERRGPARAARLGARVDRGGGLGCATRPPFGATLRRRAATGGDRCGAGQPSGTSAGR